METEVRLQLLMLMEAILTGIVLGILVDFFQIIFKHLSAPFSALTDTACLLLCGVWVFYRAQESMGGVTVLFLIGCGCGIGLYSCLLSDWTEEIFCVMEKKLVGTAEKAEKILERCSKTLKKVGKKVKKYLCK